MLHSLFLEQGWWWSWSLAVVKWGPICVTRYCFHMQSIDQSQCGIGLHPSWVHTRSLCFAGNLHEGEAINAVSRRVLFLKFHSHGNMFMHRSACALPCLVCSDFLIFVSLFGFVCGTTLIRTALSTVIVQRVKPPIKDRFLIRKEHELFFCGRVEPQFSAIIP